ncbi:MAG: histone deacetylase [Spirochaetaceae bacterium]
MILYDPQSRPALSEYGISIPIAPSATRRTIENLRADPQTADRVDQALTSRGATTVTRADLERVHSRDYVSRLFSPHVTREIERTYELIDGQGNYNRYDPSSARRPLSELFDYALGTVSGSYECCRYALERSSCFYLGGGMHHARYDTGAGFCPVNDVVIAARKIQHDHGIHKLWIIDLDVHKGDGTAALTAEDATVRTLSIHMARGWPLDGDPHLPDGSLHPSHIPSDVDIPIEEGGEEEYLTRLSDGLRALDRFERPELAIVLYGADPYEKDELPSAAGIKLSLSQMAARDELVYSFLHKRGIKQAYLKAGGYGIHAAEPLTQFLRWYLTGAPRR